MRMLFHLPDSLLCEAFNYMLHFMNDTWGPLLTLDVGRLVPQLEAFAEALQAWGCPLPLRHRAWNMSVSFSVGKGRAAKETETRQ